MAGSETVTICFWRNSFITTRCNFLGLSCPAINLYKAENMGCRPSAFEIARRTPQFQKDMEQYQAMQLSEREVRKLFNEFHKVDMDGSGSIALPELLAHLDLPVTAFTQKVFSIFDDDGSGEVDFKEFVMALWNYCTLTSATLEMFAFDLYDSDGSGEISPTEVTQMLTDLFGKQDVKTNQHAKAMAAELLDHARNFRNPFKIDTFRIFVKTHRAMLFPAFQVQLALQRKFLGTAFWENNANRRMEICNGKYVSVGTFISEHAQAASAEEMQPLKFARIGEDPAAAPVVPAGGRAVRRKSVALNNNQRKASSNGFENLTASARIRLNAAASGVQGFFASSGKHNKRTNSNLNKVYIASAKAPTMGSGNNTPAQSNAVLLSRENSMDIYAATGAASPPLPVQVRRRSHAESPFVSPQLSPRGNHNNFNIHHALSSGLNSKNQSNNSSAANLRASLSLSPAPSTTNMSHHNSNQHIHQSNKPASRNNSHGNLANHHAHNKSAGNMRRASKEPKEFEDAINAIFSNIGNSPEKGHAEGHGRTRKNSKENSSLLPVHPVVDEHEKKPRRRTSIALKDANNTLVGSPRAAGGAHIEIDMHALKHSPGKQGNRRKSFS